MSREPAEGFTAAVNAVARARRAGLIDPAQELTAMRALTARMVEPGSRR